jgi:hypothetical protein
MTPDTAAPVSRADALKRFRDLLRIACPDATEERFAAECAAIDYAHAATTEAIDGVMKIVTEARGE